jgi:hypothetical protein
VALNLYRRHRHECEAGHAEESRSGEFEERKKGWKRCDCHIFASGTIAGKFKRKYTGKTAWDDARAVAAEWQKSASWGGEVILPEPVWSENSASPPFVGCFRMSSIHAPRHLSLGKSLAVCTRSVRSEACTLELCAGLCCATVALLGPAAKPVHGRRCSESDSSGGAIVVVQNAAQALASLNLVYVSEVASLWADDSVRQTLVIPLAMIMDDEV